MAMQRVHLFVSGRVQGVHYRGTAQRTAQVLGVSGFARNLPDGRVEMVAEGDTEAVQRFIAWARVGPPHAEVTDVEVQEEAPTGDLQGFSAMF